MDIKGLIIRRFFRFSPFILIAIGIFLLVPLLRNGPSFSLVMDEPLSACRRMWWANVLFINNFFPVKDHCLSYTWYVACLMQLILLGTVFNWLVRMWPKTAITLHLLILLACNVAIGILTITVPYPPAVSLYFVEGRELMENFANGIYILPFYHASAFIIGQLTGYWCSKHPEVRLKWYTVVFSWLLFVASAFGIFFYLYPYNEGQSMGNIEAFIYSALHRVVFALLVTWFIFACSNGYGGFLNDIFSAKLFIPLHKLSFMAYLSHGVIMYIYVGTARERTYYGHTEKILQILGYVTATFLLSFLIHVIVDGPFSLVDIIIPPTSAKRITKRSLQHTERNESIIKEVPSVAKKVENGFPKEIREVDIEDKCATVIGHDNETFISSL